jgi:hypothetical protein
MTAVGDSGWWSVVGAQCSVVSAQYSTQCSVDSAQLSAPHGLCDSIAAKRAPWVTGAREHARVPAQAGLSMGDRLKHV